MKINKFEINGSKIAAYQIKQIRMVAVQVYVRAGSWYETKKQSGYFHLLEHLILSSTKSCKNNQELSAYKEEFGISCGGWTSSGEMAFWINFPDIYIKEALSLFGELLFDSPISFDNINNELTIVEQEYNDYWDNPHNRFSQEIGKRLAGVNSNLANETLGNKKSLSKVKREDLLKIYKKHFRPSNICWGISGNFKVKELTEILHQIIPKDNKIPMKKEVDVNNWKPNFGYFEYKTKVDQTSVRLIWQLPPIKKLNLTSRFGINQLNYLLGSSSNSMLFQRIRQELGLVYRIGSYYWSYPRHSHVEMWLTTGTNNVEKAIAESKSILMDIINNPIDETRRLRASKFMDLNTLMTYSSPNKISDMLSWDLYKNEKIMSPKETIAVAKKINFSKVQKWLRENIDENKLLTAIMLPE